MASWLGVPTADGYRGLSLKDLPMNYAYVVANTSLRHAGVYTVRDDCYDCPFELLQALRPDEEVSWQVDTSVQRTWRIMKNNQQKYLARSYRRGLQCEARPGMGEFGVYRLEIGLCGLQDEVAPVNSYLPLIICGLVLISIYAVYLFSKCAQNCKRKAQEIKYGKPGESEKKHKFKHSMEGLYVLRGLLTLVLIFLISGGGGYPLFNNVRGELTLADWIFYMYAWTIGVYIPATVSREKAEGLSKKNIFISIAKRALIMVFVGTVIDSMVYIPGSSPGSAMVWWMVQRLGVAYFFVATFYFLTVRNFEFKSKNILAKIVATVVSLKWCCLMAVSLVGMIVSIVLTAQTLNCHGNTSINDHLLEFSNIAADVMPGCRANVSSVFNEVAVGRSKGIYSMNGYYGFSAGLAGILTTTLIVLMGLTVGTSYMTHESHRLRLKLWGIWTTLFAASGLFIAGISFPLDLNLWPIATTFVVSSLALSLFIVVYALTEKKQSRTPVLNSTGTASLIVLSGYLLLSNSIPFDWGKKMTNHLFYLLQSFGFVSVCIVIAIIIRRRNIKFSV